MEAGRKGLAKIEGRRRMGQSGLTIAWRGTPNLDDWVAFIVNGTQPSKFILAHDTSERRVTHLLARLQEMSKADIVRLAKG